MININELSKDKIKQSGVYTLESLTKILLGFCSEMKEPDKCPVIIRNDSSCEEFVLGGVAYSVGHSFKVKLDFCKSDKIDYYTCEDKRPEKGEYWDSRGASNGDISGYVVSREAGTRLLLLTKYVLEKEEIESWLDWREFEPNYIQFKFSAKEFDVEKLHELTKDTGIITEEILRETKL